MWGNAGRLAYIKGQFKRTPTASRLPRQRQGPRHEGHDKSRHSQLSHSCDMRPGHGKGLVRLYAPRETNSAHVSTPSENPAPRRRKCRRTCAQSSDHFGCQLPPDSQTPLFPLPGEKQHHQCLDRRPIRTTTDGHVVQTTKPTFYRWVAHAPSPGRMSNPGPNWATTWSPSHAHTQQD